VTRLRHSPTLLALGVLLAAPLPAQEPPAHLASCLTDSTARFFLTEVRFLLSQPEGIPGEGPSVPADSATLETNDPVCLDAGLALGLHPPYPLAVVRAAQLYLVQPPGRAPGAVVIFDRRFRRLIPDSSRP